MLLKELTLLDHYRSGEEDVVSDFYFPCLSVSTSYDRAVGYFCSSGLQVALRGLSALLKNDGAIRLVISPALTEGDLRAIEEGYAARDAIGDAIERTSRQIIAELPTKQLELLRYLIANGRLDIRVATVAGRRPAIYHEKFGLFKDKDGEAVAFVGSSNETVSGLLANFESIEVFCSWKASDSDRVRRRRRNFDDLWRGEQRGLVVEQFPEAARRVILESGSAYPHLSAFDGDEDEKPNSGASPLSSKPEVRDYQSEAIRAWLRGNGRGILSMATGTGKTITALSLVELLARDHNRRESPFSVIIVVPYKHLVTQWNDTALKYGFRPILCYESRQLWEAQAQAEIRAVQHGSLEQTVLITTNTTFASEAFQAVTKTAILRDALLIVDEVHNIGAEASRVLLHDGFRYRLGLSATPDRHYDPDGTAAILSYFGGVVFELGLAEAIARKILVPYKYYVHRLHLTEDESSDFIKLTDQISKLGGTTSIEDPDDARGEQLKRLLIKRARIVSGAENKLPLLRQIVAAEGPKHHTLIYCGDGKHANRDDERIVHSVVSALIDDHKSADAYIASTALDTREWLRASFASGDLDYLVAIRCLDEGIDIPETEHAYFLASSTNPRQFIQRRGRVLRRSDATGKRNAEIHDFLTLLSPRVNAGSGGYAQAIALRELGRIREFAQLSQNGPQVIAGLLDLPVSVGALLF